MSPCPHNIPLEVSGLFFYCTGPWPRHDRCRWARQMSGPDLIMQDIAVGAMLAHSLQLQELEQDMTFVLIHVIRLAIREIQIAWN